jgi:hypothetical protein
MTDIAAVLQRYLGLEEQIHDYFGYVESWKIFPIRDNTKYYWYLDGEEERVFFSLRPLTPDDIIYYEGSEEVHYDYVFSYRLSRNPYRGESYTMIAVDTLQDDNKLLRIFANDKEHKMVYHPI